MAGTLNSDPRPSPCLLVHLSRPPLLSNKWTSVQQENASPTAVLRQSADQPRFSMQTPRRSSLSPKRPAMFSSLGLMVNAARSRVHRLPPSFPRT